MTFTTVSEALVFDLMYALRRAPFRAKPASRLSDEELKLIAEAIVAHLKLANWQLQQGPPID